MIKISEEFINAAAPNQSAVSNGWGLVRKNSFLSLNISEDESIIFGECSGSGSSNYHTSVDFIKEDAPVYRCSCPSRQIPCKHVLGLMYAYVSDKKFEVSKIPNDIIEKRRKADKREEKKSEQKEKGPKKANKSALRKKINTQIEGLEFLDKIINGAVQSGLGTINARTIKVLEDQAKQLGNYYLPAAQNILRDFIFLYKQNEDQEKIYTLSIDLLLMLNSMCKKGKEYLQKKLEDPELSLAANTMEEILGHTWQISELKELNQIQEDVELAQLKFSCAVSEARQEFVDLGVWISLGDGVIHQTINYRPFKAAKYINEDDSFFSVAKVKELYIYPGGINKRVRWENLSIREINKEDYHIIKSFAHKSYTEVIKSVKNQIKDPMGDKFPIVLLYFSKLGVVEGSFVIEDINGQRIVLEDNFIGIEPQSIRMIELINKKHLTNNALLVRFHNNLIEKKLRAQPLSLITDDSIIRLTF